MQTRIKDLREDKELYQKEVAKILGITQQQYSNYEKELYQLSYDGLIKLGNLYNVSIDYILKRTNKKEVNK